jgi:hypothetical protein
MPEIQLLRQELEHLSAAARLVRERIRQLEPRRERQGLPTNVVALNLARTRSPRCERSA